MVGHLQRDGAMVALSHEAPVVCMVVGIAISSLLLGTARRIIPGGPFLSVHADLIPIGINLAVLTLGVISFRKAPVEVKVLLVVLLFALTWILASTAEDILSFWFCPYARGDLLGP
jgi:hypothetical protein